MAGNPLINSMVNSETKQSDPRFGRFGANTNTQQNYGQQQAYESYGQQPAYGQPQNYNPGYGQQPQGYGQSAEDLNAMYNAPSANALDTNRLTMNDVVMKSLYVFGAILVGAVAGWIVPLLMIIGALGGFVLGLVNSFKKKVSPALIIAYGVLEGMALGGISRYYEFAYSGIVFQAVMATLVVFGVTLALFKSGKVRESKTMNKILFIFCISYGIFMLINLGAMLFFDTNLRSANPMVGLVIGAIAAFMATYSLVLDFSTINKSVQAGVPERESWRLAFGLAVTLVWLYIEILRIIGYIRELADN